jgi:ADP-ribosylglycohydrolase
MNINDQIKGVYYGWFFGPGAILRKGLDANYFNIAKNPKWSRVSKFEEIPSDYKLYDQMTQSIIVHDVLLKNKKISPELFGARLLELNEQDDILNNHQYGPSTQKAVEQLLGGADPRKTGKDGVTTGGAMRCMPVGVYFRNNEKKLIKNTYESCIISHNTDVAVSSALAVNLMITSLFKEKRKEQALKHVLNVLNNNYGKFGNPTAFAHMPTKIKDAVDFVKNKKFREATKIIAEKVGFSWFAIEQIPAAFAIYFSTKDAKEVELMSFKLGYGHTAPQIASAFHGAEKGYKIFPPEIIKKIEQVNNIEINQMVEEMISKSR